MDLIAKYSEEYWSQLKIEGDKWPFSNCYPCTGTYAAANAGILEKAKRKYAHLKSQDEIPLFLYDWAFLFPGSCGFLITNKALYASTGGVFSRAKFFVPKEDWRYLELKDKHLELKGKRLCDLPLNDYTSGHLLARLAVDAYLNNAISSAWDATSDFLLKYVDAEKSTPLYRELKGKGCKGDILVGIIHDYHEDEVIIGQFKSFIFTNYHVVKTPDGIRRRKDTFSLYVRPKYTEPTHYHAPHVHNPALKVALKVAAKVGTEIEKQNHKPRILRYDVSFSGLEALFGSNDGDFSYDTSSESDMENLAKVCADIGIPISGFPI